MDILEIPLENILEPEVPIRSVADDEKMAELVGSLAEVGLLQPLVVRPEGDNFRLIAGHRRFIALKAQGAETAPCNVVEASKTEAAILSLEENLKREDVDPLDEASFYQHLIAHYGLSQADIARKIGRTPAYVTRRLNLLKLDPETQEHIQQRRIRVDTALELARVKNKPARDYLTNIVVKDGASRGIVHTWVEDHLRKEQAEASGEEYPTDPHPPVQSTYNPPRCFICGRSLDQGGVECVWICAWEKEEILRGLEAEE